MSFDAADPGTARAEWLADPRLGAAPTVDLRGFGALVVLAAHPDDETLGAGGTLAKATREGCEVTVVCVTDGSASSGEALAQQRERELNRALDRLGILRPPILLRYADGRVREDRESITARLEAMLLGLPRDTLIVAPWVGDGHRDHRVLGEIAVSVAERAGLTLWQYPVWMWHWGSPEHADVPWSRLVALPFDADEGALVQAALGAFESQISARDGGAPLLHSRFLEHFERRADFFVV